MVAGDVTRIIEMRSRYDASLQAAALRMPPGRPSQPLPLIFAPHPFGWSVDEDYHGGCSGLRAASHQGWLEVATRMQVAVLQPFGHHRRVAGCSVGYEGGVNDVPDWVSAVNEHVPIDRDRVYACGLSMGGLECLLAVGRYPGIFAAAFVFNPVVDLASWHDDLAATAVSDLANEGNDALIVEEVGALPSEDPVAYRARSASSLVASLGQVPLTIWWSRLDAVVPRQVERHGKWLYDAIKDGDPGAPVSEYEHSGRYRLDDPPSADQCWAIHETADYAFATHWLLLHRRSGHRP